MKQRYSLLKKWKPVCVYPSSSWKHKHGLWRIRNSCDLHKPQLEMVPQLFRILPISCQCSHDGISAQKNAFNFHHMRLYAFVTKYCLICIIFYFKLFCLKSKFDGIGVYWLYSGTYRNIWNNNFYIFSKVVSQMFLCICTVEEVFQWIYKAVCYVYCTLVLGCQDKPTIGMLDCLCAGQKNLSCQLIM